MDKASPEKVHHLLRTMSLTHAAAELGSLLQLSLKENYTPLELVYRLLRHEQASREDIGRQRRLKAAGFPCIKTLADFDFGFQQSVTKTQLKQLSELAWIDNAFNILLIGPPGVGKTHLALSLGVTAAESGYRVCFTTMDDLINSLKTEQISAKSQKKLKSLRKAQLVIFDEVGFLPISRSEANMFFQLITSLYQQTSVVITSNKGFDEWSDFVGDPVISAAILDRLVHKSEILNMSGDSYRMKHRETILK